MVRDPVNHTLLEKASAADNPAEVTLSLTFHCQSQSYNSNYAHLREDAIHAQKMPLMISIHISAFCMS